MGDFSGPITGCFKIFVVIGLVIVGIITFAAYKGEQNQKEKEDKEKKEIYQKGKLDALKEAKAKIDSIKNSKK